MPETESQISGCLILADIFYTNCSYLLQYELSTFHFLCMLVMDGRPPTYQWIFHHGKVHRIHEHMQRPVNAGQE